MKINATEPLAVHCAIIDLSTGEPMPSVFEADEEAGTVSRYAVDDKGQILVEHRPLSEGGDRPKVEHLSGLRIRIDIEGAPDQPPGRMPLADYLAKLGAKPRPRTAPGRAIAHPKPLPELPADDDDGPEFSDTDGGAGASE